MPAARGHLLGTGSTRARCPQALFLNLFDPFVMDITFLSRIVASIAAAALIASCGGGGGDPPPTGAEAFVAGISPSTPQAAMLDTSTVPARRALATGLPTISADNLMDWAEYKFPTLFPKGPQSFPLQHLGVSYSVRAYPTGNYLGVTPSGEIYGLGPFNGNQLQGFGSIADWAAQVRADEFVPTITAQPQDLSVLPTQTASWTVAVAGLPVPNLQWQLSIDGGASFANINGATGPSYSFTVNAGDNGRQFRVQATNSQGSATSRAAALPLTANLLSGRAWTSGQQLATGSLIQGGTATASAIDAQGRVPVLFGKVVGSRLTLHALRSDPGGAGTAPNVSEPVAIDNGAPFDYRDGVSLAMSPAGNAVAGWNQRAPCTATTYKTGGTCNYGYYARYLVASNTWEAPQRVSDMHLPAFVASINDAGDVAALYNLPNTEAGTFALAVGWRAANQPGFTSQTWPADAVNGSFIPRAVTLDGSGRIVATGSLTQPLGKNLDIAVYRGNVHTGLGAREVVDLRGASATWQAVWTNPAGQTMLLWSQDNGTRPTVYAGALDAADGNWAVTDTGRTPPAVRVDITATLGNDGSFIWYDHPRCSALRRSAGTWTGPAALPSAMCGIVGVLGNPSLSRSGLLVSLHPTDGSWLSYDPWLNQVVSARPTAATGPGYLLSFPRSMSTVPGKLLLADNGVGSYVSVNTFDVLPTAAAPNGDSRGANSVWAWFFK